MRQTLTIADDVDNSTMLLLLLLLLLMMMVPLPVPCLSASAHSLGAPSLDDDALSQLGVYCVAAAASLVTLPRCAPLLLDLRPLSGSPAATM